MKIFRQIITIATAVTLLCSAVANAVTVSGKSPSGRAGERVGIRILKDGYSIGDLTAQNASDIIVYQNQTLTGVGGVYSFDAQIDNAKTAYIGFADSGITEEADISQPNILFDSDFSDYGGGKGDFSYLSGDSSALSAYDFGGTHARVMKAAKNSSASVFKYIYADPYDMSKKFNSGVYRIAFDYYPTVNNATFTFRLLKSKVSDFSDSSQTFETFGVNSETKLGFYENAKGWTMHYPFILQSANRWYNIVMYVDFELDRIVYYIDGEYFGISDLSNDFTSFDGFAFSTPGNADIYLDNMSLIGVNEDYAARLLSDGNEPSYELSPIRIDIKSDKTGNIFGNEDTPRFDVKYTPYNDKRGLVLTYKVLDENGETVWSESKNPKDIKSGTVYTDTVLPKIEKYGLYTLNVSAEDSDGKSAADEDIDFSYVNTADKPNESFGTVNHIAHNIGEYDKLVETEKQAGFGIVRDELFWSSFEQKKGVYSVPYLYDMYSKALSDNNIELLQIFSATNSLYTTEDPPTSEPAVDAFANYAANLCESLKGRTNYFEVWNEYNLSKSSAATPENYVKMTKAVAEKVRAKNPDAKLVGVCAGQLSGENKIIPWITQFLNGCGGEYIDALSIHIYCQDKSPERAEYVSVIKQIRTLLDSKGYGDMPIWMTETGWSLGTEGITDTLQAAYGVRANILCRQDNLIEKMFWYTSLKKHNAESAYERELGIMRDVMRENPYAATKAYLAFSSYNAMVGDKTQNSTEINADGVYKTEFENDKEYLYAVWADGTEKEYSMNVGLDRVKVYDMFGNAEEVKTNGGVLTVSAADSPIYIEMPKCEYKIYCGEKEIKSIADIKNAEGKTLKVTAALNRKGTDGENSMIFAQYSDKMLVNVSVCTTDKNSDIFDYSYFETETDIKDADKMAIFIRDKGLVKPIGKYEIR